MLELFEGRSQLVVRHFMFDPSWEDGCSSCTVGRGRDGAGALRAPRGTGHGLRRHLACAARQDRAVQGEAGLVVPVVLVVRQRLQLRLPRDARRVGRTPRVQLPVSRGAHGRRHRLVRRGRAADGAPGLSCFLRVGDDVFHTYSTYARGDDSIVGSVYVCSTSPRSVARRTGRSRRGARPLCGARTPTSRSRRPGRQRQSGGTSSPARSSSHIAEKIRHPAGVRRS